MSTSKNISFFNKTYLSYFRCVEQYAYTFIKEREEAKSLAQDVFIRFWEKMDVVDKSRDPLPYLLTITRNYCLNVLRHKKHFDSYVSYRLNRFYIDVLSSQNSNIIYMQDIQRRINEGIQEMPEKVRETFILSRNKGLKNREIADYQLISVSAVEFRLSCAFRILRNKLKDYLLVLLWLFSNWGY
jgi:RNA polymerase sigma factor, sigma-70 family/RNA polymerase sigma-70 factor, Bacteroides expansion family 1